MNAQRLTLVALLAVLTACSGGTVLPTAQTPIGMEVPAVDADMTSAIDDDHHCRKATGYGVLVDHDTGRPLRGVRVGLAPWRHHARPRPQGTTAPNGSFSVTGCVGKHLLFIGVDQGQLPRAVYSSDGRPTIHDAIDLRPGRNRLSAPRMPKIPHVARDAVEESGKYRLRVLTDSERSCIQFMNNARKQRGYHHVVADEWLSENQYAIWTYESKQNIDAAGPFYLTSYAGSEGNRNDCSDLTASDFVLHDLESLKSVDWYSGLAGGKHPIAVEEIMFDPRGPLPEPTPPSWR